MNSANSHWRYDLIKLIVTLLLLLILLLSLPKSSPEPPVSEGDNGGTVTAIAADGSQSDSQEPDNHAGPQGTQLPPFPTAADNLVVDDSQQYLTSPDGLAVYALDSESFQWIPVIPNGLLSELPQEYEIVNPGPSAWSIQGTDGQALFAWNPQGQAWEALPPSIEPVTDEDCPVALSPRLQPGDSARTLVNLNMRSSPGIKDNWMLTNIARTQLTVLSGPVCVVQEGGAYLWWEVENPFGLRGWSAEAHQGGGYYFLEPVH